MDMISKQRSSEQIVDYILEQLAERKLLPGERLPSERDFAKLLGVSRIPLREAISALSLLGIVSTRQGSGTYIKEYEPNMLSKAMYMYSALDAVSMVDLFEVRAFIEAEAARLAAERATDDDILRLREALKDCDGIVSEEALANDENATFLVFNEFHRHIVLCARNRFLQQMTDSIRLLARRYHTLGFQENPNIWAEMKKSHEDHRLIFRLIAANDGDGAYRTMLEHLRYECRCIQAVTEKEGTLLYTPEH